MSRMPQATHTHQPTDSTPLLHMRSISKRFGPVRVLCDVDLVVRSAEVHILAGENGAGKSTLIKILGGVYGGSYEGLIELNGSAIQPRSPQHANDLGIAVIYQELSLIPSMSVADNIFLGRNLCRAGGFVNFTEQRRHAKELLAELELNIDVDQPVERLPIGLQQMVEITKAISRQAKVLVMDEPTSALSAPEVAKLFHLITRLKSRHCGIVYISHKMEEIEQIADRITVLRDGRTVGSAPACELPSQKLIHWMVGREVDQQLPSRVTATHKREQRLRVEAFSVFEAGVSSPVVDSVSFTAQKGQILGIAGLQGSGASQLLLGLFGAIGKGATSGQVFLDGEELNPKSPSDAIQRGVALVTSDRKASGLVLGMSIVANSTLASLDNLSNRWGWRRPRRERDAAHMWARSLQLRAASLDLEVGALSGGNQQKVVLAKWLGTAPKLLLLNEPTRGIDVAAKREIYQLMNQWTAHGITILLITSELPELLALSDQIIVLHRGRLTARLDRDSASPAAVLHAAMGGVITAEVAA